MRRRIGLIALGLAILLPGVRLDAQNNRMGTSSATELLIPVGGRELGMGGSTIATTEGVEAIYWNPAGLGALKKSAEGMFSTMTYLADIGVHYGAVAASLGEIGSLGVSIKALSFGDVPLTTNEDPEGRSGRMFSPAFVTIGASYARALTQSISAGATFKMIVEHIDQVSSNGIAFDVGVQYRGLVGVPGLNLGVVVKNIGPQMTFSGPGLLGSGVRTDGRRPAQKYSMESASFELPALLEVGLSYREQMGENLLWSVAGSFMNRNLGLDEYHMGGEVGYTMESLHLFGRAGLNLVPQSNVDEDHIFGTSVGFGLNYESGGVDITLDYAYRSAKFFEGNQLISLKLGF